PIEGWMPWCKHSCSSIFMLFLIVVLMGVLARWSFEPASFEPMESASEEFLNLKMALLVALAIPKNGRRSADPVSHPLLPRVYFWHGQGCPASLDGICYQKAPLWLVICFFCRPSVLHPKSRRSRKDCTCCAQFGFSALIYP
ncbi:hypothetical protein QTP86_017301, partial [Hemibagrus guttatus]